MHSVRSVVSSVLNPRSNQWTQDHSGLIYVFWHDLFVAVYRVSDCVRKSCSKDQIMLMVDDGLAAFRWAVHR